MAYPNVDKSISFGNQNFFFVKFDDTDVTYEYIASMTRKGAILIGRFKKDETEGLYWLGVGVFADIWADKATLTYQLPNLLKDPKIA
jgi:hypothetical protein